MIFPTKSKITAKFGKIFIFVKLSTAPYFLTTGLDKFEPIFIIFCGNFRLSTVKILTYFLSNSLKKIEFFKDFKGVSGPKTLIRNESVFSLIWHRIKDKKLVIIAVFLLAIFLSSSASAIESVDRRKKIATSRNRKFYRTDRAKKVLGFNGYYGSDYNSRSYELGGRYLFQDNKFIHELIFQYDLEFSDSGSGKNKKFDIKTKDEYDGIFSSKIRINETPYYSVLFHRTIYDRLSTEYYDVRNALGLGRMFFDDRLELDLSGGHQRVKSSGDKFEVVASLRFNKKLTDKMSFSQRGFLFMNNGSIDNKLMTSLTYRLENKVSFEIRHDFSTRQYDDSDNIPTNRVARSITIGLVFDLS